MFYDDERNVPDLLDVLVSRSNQWKHIKLEVDPKGSRKSDWQSIRGQLDKLTSLSIDCVTGEWDFDEPFLSIFEEAPCLRSIGLHDGPARTDLILPWHQLETVHLSGCEIERALHILKDCASAVRVTLEMLMEHLFFTEDAIHLVLPNIKTLSVIVNPPMVVSKLFHYLTLPGIETLEIRHNSIVNWNAPWDISSLLGALRRSPLRSITSLALTEMVLAYEDITSLLEITPNVEKFFFTEFAPGIKPKTEPENLTITPLLLARLSLIDSYFPLATPIPNGARLLPRLKHLFLRVHAKNLDQWALVKAIISRCPGIDGMTGPEVAAFNDAENRLRSLEVVVMAPDGKPSLELLSSLKYLSDTGMSVQVKAEITEYELHEISEVSEQEVDMDDDSNDE
ncbi:hypothetical protein AAF712_003292 [Marasmius tenuissimus]|uniref:Uncharacterized protein n=1 Tax=Marasmius tenuissimus TaxID=585030 RepID=A0ABR3A8E3_9AGAR